MNYVILTIYSVVFYIAEILIGFLQIFMPKVFHFTRNRKLNTTQLANLEKERSKVNKCVIFYCSSAGEYEQAKPLFEIFQKKKYFIIILFFSVNGYKHAQSLFEQLPFFMSPLDIIWRWHRLFKLLQPTEVIIVRHEFWPCFIFLASRLSCLRVINLTVRNNSSELALATKKYFLKFFHYIYVVSDSDKIKFKKQSYYDKIKIYGDSKFDRIFERKNLEKSNRKNLAKQVNQYFSGKYFILGSAYLEDVDTALRTYSIIKSKLKQPWNLIITPHSINEKTLIKIQSACSKFNFSHIKYSKIYSNNSSDSKAEILIVDTVGQLFNFYGISNLAMVGGGYSKGVHNILEPAVFKIPICCGSRIEDEIIAQEYYKFGVLSIIKNHIELSEWWLKNERHEEDYKNKLELKLKEDTKTKQLLQNEFN